MVEVKIYFERVRKDISQLYNLPKESYLIYGTHHRASRFIAGNLRAVEWAALMSTDSVVQIQLDEIRREFIFENYLVTKPNL